MWPPGPEVALFVFLAPSFAFGFTPSTLVLIATIAAVEYYLHFVSLATPKLHPPLVPFGFAWGHVLMPRALRNP